jgi:hypothetical protein
LVKGLIKYTIVWISQNLSVPFWVVGHVHLSLNVYDDAIEIASSIGMNIIVFVGFIIDYNSRNVDKNK